jgi:hypothetical protein
MNSSRHPKESEINIFISEFQLKNRKAPVGSDLVSKFGLDLEALAIGADLLDLPGKEDLIDRVRKVDASLIPELISRYDGYPKLFNLFLQSNLYTALQIWKTNKDEFKTASKIIDQIIELNDYYVGEVRKVVDSLSQRIDMEMKGIPFNKRFIEAVEGNLNELSDINFSNLEQEELYRFFRLGSFFAFSEQHSMEISNYIEKAPEPRPNQTGHIYLSAKLGKEFVYFKVNLQAFIELWMEFDHKKLALKEKELVKLVTDELEDQGIILSLKSALFVVSVLKPEIGLILKSVESSFDLVPKAIRVLKTLELYPEEKLWEDRWNLFEESGYDTVHDFYVNNLKTLMSNFLAPDKLSAEDLGSDFYEAQYRNFINTYQNRKNILSFEELNLLKNHEGSTKETLVFMLVSQKLTKRIAYKLGMA